MQPNLRDGNKSDSDRHLPPRKRLLAGFKNSSPSRKREKPSSSKEKVVLDVDAYTNSFMDYYNKNPNLSLEEIVKESRRGVDVAVKMAVAKRAVAEKKARAATAGRIRAKGALQISADIADHELELM